MMRGMIAAFALALLFRAGAPAWASDDQTANPPTTTPAVVAAPPAGALPLVPEPPVVLAPGATTKPDYRDPASGVEVYAVLTDDMFPDEWHQSDVLVSAQPLPQGERNRLMRLMKVALSKYPPELLKLCLSRVYLVGGLRFEGIDAAATNSATCLYIEDEAENKLYTDRFIEDSFHHEFAHLIQRSYREEWDPALWIACNPPAFSYHAESGVEAVRSGKDSEEPTDEWNRQGFLCEYGASDAAEDFATIVADLLNGDDDFWKRVDKFPALKAKVKVAIGFYGSLDDRFTEPYFRGLHPGIAYVPPSTPPTTLTASVGAGAGSGANSPVVDAPTDPPAKTSPPPTPGSTGPAAKP